MLIPCSEEEPRVLDIRFIDDQITDSDVSENRAGFRDEVIARDRTCIVTAAPVEYCDACHYCPHSKGSEVRHFVGLCLLFSSHTHSVSTSSGRVVGWTRSNQYQ